MSAVAPMAQGNSPQGSLPSRQPPLHDQSNHAAPPSCLPNRRNAPIEKLVDLAAVNYDGGNFAKSLSCADEALGQAPRRVSALHYRAASLVALDRVDEGRVAFAHALAIDPNDAETLAGAADLYISRLSSQRTALETGLEYALRGARLASQGPDRDRVLVGRLHLLAGMAQNDLGRSKDALYQLEQSLEHRPSDVNARYERGVALYELCRFGDARRAFEKVLESSPDDAWTLHYLGLLEEREHKDERAHSYFKRSAHLAPKDFRPAVAIDRRAFEQEVRTAVAALPEAQRRSLAGVPVRTEEIPAIEDLVAVDPPLSPSILGLFRGPALGEPCTPDDGPSCRAIVFYRRNLLRFARDRQDLSEQVRVTLLHELGHLNGENDDQLRLRGLE